jgi:hypothetical protein
MRIYLACALVGGALVALRCLLALFFWGSPDKTAGESGHQAHQLANLLDLVTLPLAGLAGFGLAGAIASARGCSEAVACGFGLGMALLVVLPISLLSWLSSRRSFSLERTLNCNGVVSTTVPAQHGGAGCVVVALPSRVVEVRAVTAGQAIPEGTKVRVRAVVDPRTVEVATQEDFDQIWRQAKPQ